MSTIGKDISPGRARALAESGSKIEPDRQYMAPDGHPAGPEAAEDMAAKLPEPLSAGGEEVKPKALRASPIKHR
jgi:hypothetical protein